MHPLTLPAHLVHDDLNPDIWDDAGKMRLDVRKALLLVAADFIAHLSVVPSDAINDIVLTGSMANFNWTAQSDLDLHVIVQLNKVDPDTELVEDLLQEKRATWNASRHVFILGHPVEAYPQDSLEVHHSSGVYSVRDDDWIVRPSAQDPRADTGTALIKARGIAGDIDRIAQDVNASSDDVQAMREKIRRFRKCGLDQGGEFSTENLAFKALRNAGYLDQLSSLSRSLRDRELSLG